jgi:chorismate synthase
MATKEPFLAQHERSDTCTVPAAGVIGESMVALVLASAFLEKFGGDSLQETLRNYNAYLDQLRAY